jgi:hypothetical protein
VCGGTPLQVPRPALGQSSESRVADDAIKGADRGPVVVVVGPEDMAGVLADFQKKGVGVTRVWGGRSEWVPAAAKVAPEDTCRRPVAGRVQEWIGGVAVVDLDGGGTIELHSDRHRGCLINGARVVVLPEPASGDGQRQPSPRDSPGTPQNSATSSGLLSNLSCPAYAPATVSSRTSPPPGGRCQGPSAIGPHSCVGLGLGDLSRSFPLHDRAVDAPVRAQAFGLGKGPQPPLRPTPTDPRGERHPTGSIGLGPGLWHVMDTQAPAKHEGPLSWPEDAVSRLCGPLLHKQREAMRQVAALPLQDAALQGLEDGIERSLFPDAGVSRQTAGARLEILRGRRARAGFPACWEVRVDGETAVLGELAMTAGLGSLLEAGGEGRRCGGCALGSACGKIHWLTQNSGARAYVRVEGVAFLSADLDHTLATDREDTAPGVWCPAFLKGSCADGRWCKHFHAKPGVAVSNLERDAGTVRVSLAVGEGVERVRLSELRSTKGLEVLKRDPAGVGARCPKRGSCAEGDECSFLHWIDEGAEPPAELPAEQNVAPLPADAEFYYVGGVLVPSNTIAQTGARSFLRLNPDRSAQWCKYDLIGRCAKGSQCSFAHRVTGPSPDTVRRGA